MKLALLILLGAALLAGGCGQAEDGGAGAEPGQATSVESEPRTESDRLPTAPPSLVLMSAGGRQEGVIGSFCVGSPKERLGACVDGMAPAARELTVVRPGDTVTIALEDARAVKSKGCHARDLSCIGEAQVAPRGCATQAIRRVFIERGSETAWRVTLPAGEYELQLFVYFETDEGRAGDVSAAFGLRVDPDAWRGVVPAPPAPAVCQ